MRAITITLKMVMLNFDAEHQNLFEAVRPQTFFCNLLLGE